MVPLLPFERLKFSGESVTLNTEGKVLVLPSGNPAVLPSFNEYTLNSNRLSVAESPFGGLKGSGSPDYAVGTLYTPTDGVYLADTSGTNSTKTLTAGKLSELSLLTVDTDAHTITEEFTLRNDSESNNPVSVLAANTATGFSYTTGSGTITSDGTIITLSGTPANSILRAAKVISPGVNIGTCRFIKFSVTSSVSCSLNFLISSNTSLSTNFSYFSTSKFYIPANTLKTFVLPIFAPPGLTGQTPTELSGSIGTTLQYVRVGVESAGSSPITVTFSDITADTGKSAYIEASIPDHLSATSASLYTHNGTAYALCRSDSLNGTYSNVSQTSANATLADGTLFDHVYTTGLGRAVYPKGEAGDTKTGSIGSMTYSANPGTLKRIGYRFDLPPDDGGRTLFDTVRAKLVINYAPDTSGNYSASYQFADSTNASYGLQNMTYPWCALYDQTSSEIDFYLPTHRFKNLEFKRDETGTIYELKLYPGNGLLYHGRIHYNDLTADSDSNDIPNCLEATLEGSLTKFLQSYGMVI